MTARCIILFLSLLLGFTSAQADWSANIGRASDYYYRGILQWYASSSML